LLIFRIGHFNRRQYSIPRWNRKLPEVCHKFNLGKITCFKVISQGFLEDDIYRSNAVILIWKLMLH